MFVEPVLVEVIDTVGMHKLMAEKTDDGANENRLSVFTSP